MVSQDIQAGTRSGGSGERLGLEIHLEPLGTDCNESCGCVVSLSGAEKGVISLGAP